MLEELLRLLPSPTGSVAVYAALAGCVAGLGLWAAGAKFSRALLTLVAVFIGAAVGKSLPVWMNWTVDGMGPAVGLAVSLGISAYAMHRMWVGVALGIVLTIWAAIATCVLVEVAQPWVLPAVGTWTTLPQYLGAIWKSVPPEVAKILPFACAGAFLTGLVPAVVWPRIGTPMLYSVGGLSLAVITGAMAATATERAWLAKVSMTNSMQASVLGGAVLLGVAVQSWFMRGGAVAAAGKGGGGSEQRQEESRPPRRKAA